MIALNGVIFIVIMIIILKNDNVILKKDLNVSKLFYITSKKKIRKKKNSK